MKEVGKARPEDHAQSDHRWMKEAVSPQVSVELILFFFFDFPIIAHEVLILLRQHRLETNSDHPVEEVKVNAAAKSMKIIGKIQYLKPDGKRERENGRNEEDRKEKIGEEKENERKEIEKYGGKNNFGGMKRENGRKEKRK